MSEDIARFDRWSHTYEASWMQDFLFDRVHRVLLAMAAEIEEPRTILDVGCGTGRLLRAAAAQWSDARLIGVDPAPGMVQVARQLTPAATIYEGTAESLPIPPASIDLVVSTLSFHHWHDQAAGIRGIERVLLPGKHFFLADAYAPSWFSFLTRHNLHMPPDKVRTFFTLAGLDVVEQKEVLSRYLVVTHGVRAALI